MTDEPITLAGAFEALAASDKIDPSAVPVEPVDVVQTYKDTIDVLKGRLEAQEIEITRLTNRELELNKALVKGHQRLEPLTALRDALMVVLEASLIDMIDVALDNKLEERLRTLDEDLDLDSKIERTVEEKFNDRDFDEAVRDVISNLNFTVEVSRY